MNHENHEKHETHEIHEEQPNTFVCFTVFARFVVFVVFVVGLFVACGMGPKDLTRVRIAVGGQPQLIYLPLTLADRLGYYTDARLRVEIQDFPGGARALQSLLGGSADVVCGYYDHTVQMAAEGRVMVAFVSMLRYPVMIAVVAPQPKKPIAAMADLKGAMIGVTSPGSATHFFLNYLLTRGGVRPDEVSVTGIGTSASAVAALERSQVDAGIVVEPTFTQLSRRVPGVRVLADTRTAEGVKATFGVDVYPAAVLYAPEGWLQSNRDTAARLARAIMRTIDWIRSHSPEEVADKVPEFVGSDRAAYLEALGNTLPAYSVDGRLDVKGAEAVKRVLALSIDRIRTTPVDVRRTFTNEFVGSPDR
jgi:NitT/TauT family transport system substrate-binding protein